MSGTAIITGGAAGIGFETARILKERGWSPCLVDLRRDALDEACEKLGLPREAAFALNVADEAAVEEVVAEIVSRERLTGIVNCAGIGADKPLTETSVDEFRRIIEVNLTGTFIVSRAAARHWLAKGEQGVIVNISSISGMIGNKGRSAYGASKGAVNTMTMVLANELGPAGIRVNAVAPGPIDTALARAIHTHDVRQQWHARVPLRRYGEPHEIARVVAFLLSDEASYVNGHILAADGGFVTAGLAN